MPLVRRKLILSGEASVRVLKETDALLALLFDTVLIDELTRLPLLSLSCGVSRGDGDKLPPELIGLRI